MKIERYLSLGCPISFDFLPLKIKRLSDNQAESSVSVCENEKIRTTQGRGSTQHTGQDPLGNSNDIYDFLGINSKFYVYLYASITLQVFLSQ